uniref:hypothetical protein n=1 Tax=Alkalihalobacillus trypoxylicola TaxID=519424 RepID=UPI000A835390
VPFSLKDRNDEIDSPVLNIKSYVFEEEFSYIESFLFFGGLIVAFLFGISLITLGILVIYKIFKRIRN